MADLISVNEDLKIKEYSSRLLELRANGVNAITLSKEQIANAKSNKMLSENERDSIITQAKANIVKAKENVQLHKYEIKQLEKEAVAYSNTISKPYQKQECKHQDTIIAQARSLYKSDVEQIKIELNNKITQIKSSDLNQEQVKKEIALANFEAKSALFDAKSKYTSVLDRAKAAKNQVYVDTIQTNISLRNGRTNFAENTQLKYRNYIFNFKASKFFLDNGLYLAILIFFITCVIIAPLQGNGHLLSLPNIFTILEQSSTRMFYALGVAGLILQGGTDLSIGRMVALGSVLTGMILHPGANIVSLFGMTPFNCSDMAVGLRIFMALGISVVLCVAFSAFAGLFTARLKMHPFISTLATQLIIYGLLFYGTSGTPVGSIDSTIKDAIGGRWILGAANGNLITFPKLIIPAVIAIAIAWFIWNKTIFGKNMYAVGGNSEAAAVSGINVFKTTMFVFILAGIFYGCGAFLEAFKANASAGTGQGYELDAIAACVVGGISFNGGIGKISGAVIGVIIFTSLTYCLTFLGIDTNLQFVFKGLILITAVALDSMKYLKKK